MGVLRRALVHRPDLSLRRLTPANDRDLLFAQVLWVQKAREEHDVMVDLLEDEDAKGWILDQEVNATGHGVWAGALREILDEISADELAEHLIGGQTADELLTGEAGTRVAAG